MVLFYVNNLLGGRIELKDSEGRVYVLVGRC